MAERASRYPARFPVLLRHGAHMFPATICNISTGGACLLGTDKLGKGDTFTLDYELGQTRATVMWTVGQMVGVRFDDQLSMGGVAVIRTDKEELRRA